MILFACAQPVETPVTREMVPAAAAPAPTLPHPRGALVYVPVYSSVYVAEGNQTFDLTVTVTVRNTDRKAPITVSTVSYYDTAGKLLHAYVEQPLHLAPMASADTVVRASDTRAGVGGSFLVAWSSGAEVSEPLVEAVMVGTGHQQGLSWVSRGIVLEYTGG